MATPSISAADFVRVMAHLVATRWPDAKVVADHHVDGFVIDIAVVDGRAETYVTCNASSTLVGGYFAEISQRLIYIKRRFPDVRVVLAIPGQLTAHQARFLRDHRIELWDSEYLLEHFRAEITDWRPHLYQKLSLSVPLTHLSPAKLALTALRACNPGRRDWSRYQRAVGELLEILFCPPLERPLPELSDANKINRRDFIFPNYADSGFWRFIRERYSADYVVVDAKSYSTGVKKQHVLQMVNYLKPYGTGGFGLIVARKESDRAATITMREHWISQGKLVLSVSDSDLEAMVIAHDGGGRPEEVLRQRIQEFRLEL